LNYTRNCRTRTGVLRADETVPEDLPRGAGNKYFRLLPGEQVVRFVVGPGTRHGMDTCA